MRNISISPCEWHEAAPACTLTRRGGHFQCVGRVRHAPLARSPISRTMALHSSPVSTGLVTSQDYAPLSQQAEKASEKTDAVSHSRQPELSHKGQRHYLRSKQGHRQSLKSAGKLPPTQDLRVTRGIKNTPSPGKAQKGRRAGHAGAKGAQRGRERFELKFGALEPSQVRALEWALLVLTYRTVDEAMLVSFCRRRRRGRLRRPRYWRRITSEAAS